MEKYLNKFSHIASKRIPSKDFLYKYIGIVFLVVQQASQPLVVKLAQDRQENEVFITTVNIFLMEVVKLVVCSVILIVKEKSIIKYGYSLKVSLIDDFVETLKVCVPAAIFVVQNILYFVALANLEVTTFSVTYQLKILTTAVVLRWILHKKLSSTQWVALVILVIGVSSVQYQPPKVAETYTEQNTLIGLVAVITMCFTSAFASVYMEKVFKQSTTNVWMHNIRIALFGLVIAAGSILYQDLETVQRDGFFRGWDFTVWAMTFNNSLGGLLIAVVIKYADNILKSYAQSVAIIGTAIGSWMLFDFAPSSSFVFGSVLVIASIVIYTRYPYKARENLGSPQKISCGQQDN